VTGLLLLLVALTMAGCSKPSSASQSAAGSSTGNEGIAQAGPPSVAGKAPAHAVEDLSQPAQPQQRAVISTGKIVLVSSDLTSARTRLDAVLTQLGGHVADENTLTDDHGNVTSSHLVIRVPSAHFDQAMTQLAGVASLRSSSRQAEDVTTRVIDLGARIAAERAGVRRLRDLVSRTASLPALLAVERALTERQGELESLRQQRAYLADQTSLATISVDLMRRTVAAPVERTAGGFVGGLRHGWHALVTLVVGLLVGVGAALPFALTLGLLGLPTWLVVRRVLRTRRVREPVES
jgi:hypothetical protein